MDIILQPQNVNDIFKLFGFLKEYSIPFQVPPESVTSLKGMLQHHNLELFKDILIGTPFEELCLPKTYEQKLLLPSSALKIFCGSEWTISGKYVTEEFVSLRIEQYASINHLKNGMYLELDETLRTLLCTDKPVVNDYELRELYKNITSHL